MYDFSELDFNISMDILNIYLTNGNYVPWNSLRLLIGEVTAFLFHLTLVASIVQCMLSF